MVVEDGPLKRFYASISFFTFEPFHSAKMSGISSADVDGVVIVNFFKTLFGSRRFQLLAVDQFIKLILINLKNVFCVCLENDLQQILFWFVRL